LLQAFNAPRFLDDRQLVAIQGQRSRKSHSPDTATVSTLRPTLPRHPARRHSQKSRTSLPTPPQNFWDAFCLMVSVLLSLRRAS
jgi:hypothetical protein